MGILPWIFGRNIQELKIKHVATLKHIAHLRQECHNSKFVIFQEKILKVFKCYNFVWVQRRHNCSPAANFGNCVMTLYLLKVHLQTFLSITVTQKCQILSFDTLVANERYLVLLSLERSWNMVHKISLHILVTMYTHSIMTSSPAFQTPFFLKDLCVCVSACTLVYVSVSVSVSPRISTFETADRLQ